MFRVSRDKQLKTNLKKNMAQLTQACHPQRLFEEDTGEGGHQKLCGLSGGATGCHGWETLRVRQLLTECFKVEDGSMIWDQNWAFWPAFLHAIFGTSQTMHISRNTPTPPWSRVVAASCCGDRKVYEATKRQNGNSEVQKNPRGKPTVLCKRTAS